MIKIKNYYDQQQELNIAFFKLKSLEEKKEMYFNMTQPKAMSIKNDVIVSGGHNDSFAEYVSKVELIDEKIENTKSEIKILDFYLKKMESSLRKMKGSLEKIFVDKYIDNLSVKKIAIKENYSQSDIYRKLSIIRTIIKDEKK